MEEFVLILSLAAAAAFGFYMAARLDKFLDGQLSAPQPQEEPARRSAAAPDAGAADQEKRCG